MPRKRTSIIWTTSKKKLQNMLNNNNSMTDILKKLNMSPYSGNHRTLNKRIIEDKLDITILNKNRKARAKERMSGLGIKNTIPLSKILVIGSDYNRTHLKARLIKNNLLYNKCYICNNKGEWNNRPLSLQLDHINGISNDNRLKNLRLLCPNCHSQTDTFSGKRHKKDKNIKCPNCDNTMSYQSKMCLSCKSKKQMKFQITKEELVKLLKIDKMPFTKIGKMFGVSDNTIRYRARKFKII